MKLHSWVRATFDEQENRILFEHMIHNLIVSTARICGLYWADLVTVAESLVSKASSLRVIICYGRLNRMETSF